MVSAERSLRPSTAAEAALLFSSGMAATATLLAGHLKAGDEVVCSAAVYGGTLHLLARPADAVRHHPARSCRSTTCADLDRVLTAAPRGWSGSSRRSTRRCGASTSRRGRRGVPRARRPVGSGQHVRQPDQPAAAARWASTWRCKARRSTSTGTATSPAECVSRDAPSSSNRWIRPADYWAPCIDPQAALLAGARTEDIARPRWRGTTPTHRQSPSFWRRIAALATCTIPVWRHIPTMKSRRTSDDRLWRHGLLRSRRRTMREPCRLFDRLTVIKRAASLGGVESLASLPVLT